MPPLPVLVLNLDGRRWLEPCFTSLLDEAGRDPRLEPWLVDNGSGDGSVDFVRARFPAVRVVAFGENLGFTGAYDQVLRDDGLMAGRPLAVLLNNDVRVAPGFLPPLLAAMDDPEVAIAGSLLLSGDGTRIDHAGGQVAVIGAGVDLGKFAAAPPAASATAPTPAAAVGGPLPPGPTGFACGGALCVRRDAYLAVGGFDPDYVIYHEDVDLAWRAWLLGYRVVHVPASVVFHEGGALMGRPDSPRRLFLSQRNRLRNLVRLSGARRLALGVAASAAFDLLRAAGFARRGDGARLAALARADAAIVAELPALLRARQELQRRRVRDDRELESLGVFAPLGASVRAYLDQRAAAAP